MLIPRTPGLRVAFQRRPERIEKGASKMARPEGETSNSLLDVLVEWNARLERRGQQSPVVGQARLMASTA